MTVLNMRSWVYPMNLEHKKILHSTDLFYGNIGQAPNAYNMFNHQI